MPWPRFGEDVTKPFNQLSRCCADPSFTSVKNHVQHHVNAARTSFGLQVATSHRLGDLDPPAQADAPNSLADIWLVRMQRGPKAARRQRLHSGPACGAAHLTKCVR